MKLGIVGVPTSGKTTVFNALTGAHRTTGGYSAGTSANVAVVKVPDERMAILSEMFQPKKVTYATIEYVDMPGIMSDASRDEIAGAFAALREVDALLHVVRLFESEASPHPRSTIDPERDIVEIHDELLFADLDIIEKRIQKLEKSVTKPSPTQQADKKELDILSRCREAIEMEKGISSVNLNDDEKRIIRGYRFLTEKPTIMVLNVGEEQLGDDSVKNAFAAPKGDDAGDAGAEPTIMCAELESEIADLEEEERDEYIKELGIGEPASAKLIQASYTTLKLRSFFTIVSGDMRAWTVTEGDNAVAAAGKIHTDMARGFIRAEVVGFDDLRECGDMKEARAKGKVRLEGKDYIVQDGDIITFRFNV